MTNHGEVVQAIEALQFTLQTPGWALITKQLKSRADQEMASMRNAKGQDDLLRHTYTYMALQDLMTAPEMLLKVLSTQLSSMQKK